MKTKQFTHKVRRTLVAFAAISSMLMPMTVGAATSTESVTTQEVMGDTTESVPVNSVITSRFSVRLPKTITLDGSKKSAAYKVSCKEDYPANQKAVAVPDPAVTLSSANKGSVTAPISQDKTECLYNECNVEGNDSVAADSITAGEGSEFGATNSEHTHSYTEEITKEPTCTEAGEKTLTCSCEDVKIEAIPATGHNMENNFCTKCGQVDEDVFSEPGLYSYRTGELRTSWIDLVKTTGFDITAADYSGKTDGITVNPYSEEYVLVVPEGPTKVSAYAFRKTYKMAGIVLPKSVTTLEREAFYVDKPYSSTEVALKFVVMKGVKSIGEKAFANQENLKIYGMENVETLAYSAFDGYYERASYKTFENLCMPNAKSIGDYAFGTFIDIDNLYVGPECKTTAYSCIGAHTTSSSVYGNTGPRVSKIHYYRQSYSQGTGATKSLLDDWLHLYEDENGNHVHSFLEPYTTKSANCYTTGEKATACKACDCVTYETLPKTTHTAGSDGKTCKYCGAVNIFGVWV